MKGASSVLIVILTGFILFVVGAASLWDGPGFAMALGFVLLLFANTAISIRSRFWTPKEFRQRSKRDRQVAEAIKVGDRIELHSFDIQPPSRWEPVEVIAILPRARDGHVMVQVRHADGTESAQSLTRLWRIPSSDTWRPLTG